MADSTTTQKGGLNRLLLLWSGYVATNTRFSTNPPKKASEFHLHFANGMDEIILFHGQCFTNKVEINLLLIADFIYKIIGPESCLKLVQSFLACKQKPL